VNIKYRPEIDGLRAISVIAVIFYHLKITIFDYQLFTGGFIGVDIFFVISGYLITFIIFNELILTETFSFKYFYERRIRRILPTLLFVILLTIPFAWMVLLPTSFIDFSKSILYSLGFSSNYYFFLSGQTYGIDVGLLKPFLHTWSLSLEEQFYILFPIFLFFSYKYLNKFIGIFLISFFLISLLLADWGAKSHPAINFYGLPTRIWELLAGSILAYYEVLRGQRSKNLLLNFVMSCIGFSLIVHAILFFNVRTLHPSFYTLSPVIGVCLIIWFSCRDDLITKILSCKLLVGIGLISYSLYLWHYPIIVFFEAKFYFFNNLLKLTAFFFSILISIFTYFYIEKYSRYKINFILLFKKIFVIYLLIFLCLSIIIYNRDKIIIFKNQKTHYFLNIQKYEEEHNNFKINYNYNNFDKRKNIFIVGNSYGDDLLNVFNYNNELNKKFYFYTASKKTNKEGDINTYQILCFLEFLKNKTTVCNGYDFTSHLIAQYEKSNFIILIQKDNILNNNLKYYFDVINEINKSLKKDNKKLLVLLNDVNGRFISSLNDLDRFTYIFKRIPNNDELEFIEKQFYRDSMDFQKENLKNLKNQFNENHITFMTRSELFCNHILKKCTLIAYDKDKIYSDYGHLTDSGARFFSNFIVKVIENLQFEAGAN